MPLGQSVVYFRCPHCIGMRDGSSKQLFVPNGSMLRGAKSLSALGESKRQAIETPVGQNGFFFRSPNLVSLILVHCRVIAGPL